MSLSGALRPSVRPTGLLAALMVALTFSLVSCEKPSQEQPVQEVVAERTGPYVRRYQDSLDFTVRQNAEGDTEIVYVVDDGIVIYNVDTQTRRLLEVEIPGGFRGPRMVSISGGKYAAVEFERIHSHYPDSLLLIDAEAGETVWLQQGGASFRGVSFLDETSIVYFRPAERVANISSYSPI